ncbi:MAG: His/Gly/Thr/Pro-type tRNA ligase C-terminal domain-containing protein, partial [Chthoniobacterales bacterium]
RDAVLEAATRLSRSLHGCHYMDEPLRVEIDKRDLGGGVKKWEWVKMGVPIRLEIGPRDLEKKTVALSRRDRPANEKEFVPFNELPAKLPAILEEIQANLLAKATAFRQENTRQIDNKEDFYAFFTPKDANKPEIHGGFALTHWDGSLEVEEQIKNDLKVTIRCIPNGEEFSKTPGTCPFSGNPSKQRVIWAKSY